MHSHLIPGIDDGAQSDEESLVLLKGLQRLGYKKCITTPHIYPGFFNNTAATVNAHFSRLKEICTEHALSIHVEAAAEYFFDTYFFELVEQKQLLTFGNNYVLFELPVSVRPVMVEDIVFKMSLNCYRPVMAHPERYFFYHDRKMNRYQKLKDHGVFFQLNLLSLTGYYNEQIRMAACDLVRHQLVDFAGSDLHKEKQLPFLDMVREDPFYEKLLSSGKLLNHEL